MKNKLKIILGIIISIAFLIFGFWSIDFKEALNALKDINYIVILPAIIVQTSSYYVRSIRWALMLRSIKPLGASRLFPTVSISYAINNTMPLRAGDVARAYLLGRKENISKTASFSTIIIEKIYDGITLLLFLGMVALIYPFSERIKSVGIFAAVLFTGALLLIIIMVSHRPLALTILGKLLRPVSGKTKQKILQLTEKFMDGFDIIKDKRSLFPIAVLSVVIWLMEAFMVYSVGRAFNLSMDMGMAIFTLVVVNLTLMLPSSPGYLGVFETSTMWTLGLSGVSSATCAAFAIVFRFALFTPTILIGYYYLFKEGISISSLTKGDKQ